LAEAHRSLLAYRDRGNVGDLSAAWDIYYHIFRKINKMLPNLSSLELQTVSPVLLAAHDLELSVPGTYHAGSPVVRIMSFCPAIDVLPTKQKPRKVRRVCACHCCRRHVQFLLFVACFGYGMSCLGNQRGMRRRRGGAVCPPPPPHTHTCTPAARVVCCSRCWCCHLSTCCAPPLLLQVTLLGSDGRQYTFLLKGHEDLRQDERVMQLFGLVNTLLANDSETSKRDLSIRRYAVTPLSHDAGVVGWVPNCDTLHYLIREYRDSRKILLNIEHRLMVQMAPMYDHLTVLQKVEVFRFALDNTTGQDLYKVLWLKSASSEVWLDRRTNYTRSLAGMSIVGYILGLGDRHPSNLMLDRVSGKILHIDFGDCFEVAMTREKIPERIPFRLTRMFVNAMEVSGIEGNYRSVCEAVMRVLREHRDSVMAMLEAFVHDPLINWRLLTNAAPAPTEGGPGGGGGAADGAAAGAGATHAPTAVGAAGGGHATAVLPPPRRRTGSVVAGAHRLAETDPAVTTMLQQGIAFAAEAEAAATASAMVASGIGAGGDGADAAPPDAATAAFARSLVSSVHSNRGERERELMQVLGPEGAAAPTEAVNERAMAVIRRIQAKLTGRDFAEDDPIGRMMSVGVGLSGGIGVDSSADGSGTLDVAAQVQRLICAATSHENLSQSYVGWCPFW
jgi:FKBP12-rapamycin complex-associated protein